MANPSLQIGNDNWAIKEDNLLGYSTAGTRFVPQPITMTRATLGTRVNPSGLVEDVALLGSEEVVNGDFATDSDWTKGTGWTISGGNASFNTTTNNSLTQSGFANSKIYKVSIDVVSYVRGNPFIAIGQGSQYTIPTSIGTHIIYVTSGSVDAILRIYSGAFGSGGEGSIDNVSVKEATIDNLPRVDYTDGTSSLLVEPQRRNLVTQSELFSDSSWLKVGSITTTDNYTTSPSGQNNATRLQWTNATNYIYQSLSHVGSDFTLSIYLKSNTDVSQNVRLFMDNGAQGQDVVVTTQWQRFEFTNTSTPTQSNRNTGLIKSSSQVGDLDISIWGAQFEEGSYPTSYIKTSGSTVTRNQETYTKTGISDKIGQTEGTFFIELSKPVLEPDSYYLISLNNAASNSDDNSVVIGFENSNDFFLRVQSNGTDVFYSNNFDALNVNTFYKIAVSYKSGQSLIYIDGSPITPNGGNLSNAFVFTATLDNLSFDFNGNNGLPFFGKVKQLQVFKTALTGSELATLTT